MKWKNETKFKISGLNQEKLLNELAKNSPLCEIERHSKENTSFKCSYFDHKKVAKILKTRGVKVEAVEHEGLFFRFKKAFSSYGLILAILLCSGLYFFQNQYVVQYQVQGVDKLSKTQIVDFVKENYPQKKIDLDTKAVEIGLVDKFCQISFVSCMVKGQTLVINIKEKLLPEEMYGDFAPLVAEKNGKICEIDLISGTLCVKVGEIVQKGDVLVQPYTIDTSGQIKKVEAKAEIKAEVYNEGTADHYETFIEVKRSGKFVVQNDITLFGLSIYTFKEENNFKMFEVEKEDVDLVRNLVLPFKMRKSYIYELVENIIETKFEDVKEEYIEKARKKALENVEDCDKIKDEYFTIRHISGVTIVNFCVVTEENIETYEKT